MFRYTARLRGIALAAILIAVALAVSGCSASLTIVIPLEEQVADALDDLAVGMQTENIDRVMNRYEASYTSDSLYYPGKTDKELLRDEVQYFFSSYSNIQVVRDSRVVQSQSPSTALITENWTVTAWPDPDAAAKRSDYSVAPRVVITPTPPKTQAMWFQMLKKNGKWFIISDSMPELLSQF